LLNAFPHVQCELFYVSLSDAQYPIAVVANNNNNNNNEITLHMQIAPRATATALIIECRQ